MFGADSFAVGLADGDTLCCWWGLLDAGAFGLEDMSRASVVCYDGHVILAKCGGCRNWGYWI